MCNVQKRHVTYSRAYSITFVHWYMYGYIKEVSGNPFKVTPLSIAGLLCLLPSCSNKVPLNVDETYGGNFL